MSLKETKGRYSCKGTGLYISIKKMNTEVLFIIFYSVTN